MDDDAALELPDDPGVVDRRRSEPPAGCCCCCCSPAERGSRGASPSRSTLQVVCPSEKTLPFKGRVKFHDIESAKAPAIDVPQVEAVREEYERRFAAHQEQLREIAKACGWRFHAADTSQRPQDVLMDVYNGLAVKKKV